MDSYLTFLFWSMYYRYRAAAFSGVRSFSGVATGGTRVCTVVACSNDTIHSCGRRFPKYIENATTIFEELEIVAEVPTAVIDDDVETRNSAYFPVSLDTSIMPLEIGEYTFEEKHTITNTVYEYKLRNFEKDLYAFSIWGRVYETDGQDASPPVDETNNAIAVRIGFVSLVISLFVGFNII